MTRIWILFLIVAIDSIANAHAVSNPYYTYDKKFKAYYKVYQETTWPVAVLTCSGDDAFLAVPTASEETGLILQLTGGKRSWIGIHDLFTKGEWMTLNGTSTSNIYMNWKAGEPNNLGGNQQCGALFPELTMDDEDCLTKTFPFVCKRTKVNDEEYCKIFNCVSKGKSPFFRRDYTYIPQVKAFYKAHKSKTDWYTAMMKCAEEGADLAYMISVQEKTAVLKLAENSDVTFWSGLNELIKKGEWKLVNGVRPSYIPWQAGEPNNLNGKQHCSTIARNNLLMDDENCDRKFSYFCKREYKKC